MTIFPVAAGTPYGRADQGVDFAPPVGSYVRAVASGTVVGMGQFGFPGQGTYPGTNTVYEQLDQPITVNGRSYPDVYYAEESPLVAKGTRIVAGQPVEAVVQPSRDVEVGFALAANQPASSDSSGAPTQPGQDFADYLHGSHASTVAPNAPSAGIGGGPSSAPNPGGDFGPGGGSFGGSGGDFAGSTQTASGQLAACWGAVTSGFKWYEPWTYGTPVVGTAKAVGCSLGWLGHYLTGWLTRFGLILAGGALVIVGLFLIARKEGVSPV